MVDGLDSGRIWFSHRTFQIVLWVSLSVGWFHLFSSLFLSLFINFVVWSDVNTSPPYMHTKNTHNQWNPLQEASAGKPSGALDLVCPHEESPRIERVRPWSREKGQTVGKRPVSPSLYPDSHPVTLCSWISTLQGGEQFLGYTVSQFQWNVQRFFLRWYG